MCQFKSNITTSYIIFHFPCKDDTVRLCRCASHVAQWPVACSRPCWCRGHCGCRHCFPCACLRITLDSRASLQDVLAAGGVVGGGKPVQGVSDGGAVGGSGGAAGLATKAASAVHAAQAGASGSFQISALVRAAPAVHACIML